MLLGVEKLQSDWLLSIMRFLLESFPTMDLMPCALLAHTKIFLYLLLVNHLAWIIISTYYWPISSFYRCPPNLELVILILGQEAVSIHRRTVLNNSASTFILFIRSILSQNFGLPKHEVFLQQFSIINNSNA